MDEKTTPKTDNKNIELRIVGKTIPTQKHLPKAFIRNAKINTDNEGHFATVSAWIADTPQSVYKPKLVLSLKCVGTTLRLMFSTARELSLFLEECQAFALDCEKDAEQALADAKREHTRVRGVIENEVAKEIEKRLGLQGTDMKKLLIGL